MDFSNKVRIAIDRLGGPTRTANIMGCSGAAVHAWIRNQKISNIEKARKVAEMVGMEVRELRPCR